MVTAQLWPAGHHDARIPKEALRRPQDPGHPGCALPVHLYLHQDLGEGLRRSSTAPGSVSCRAFPPLGRASWERGGWEGWEGWGMRGSMDRGSWEKRWREGHLFPLPPKLWQPVWMVRVTERDSESPDSPFVGGCSPSWGQAVIRPIEPDPPGPLVRWVDAV